MPVPFDQRQQQVKCFRRERKRHAGALKQPFLRVQPERAEFI
jgi:hypothetical protein